MNLLAWQLARTIDKYDVIISEFELNFHVNNFKRIIYLFIKKLSIHLKIRINFEYSLKYSLSILRNSLRIRKLNFECQKKSHVCWSNQFKLQLIVLWRWYLYGWIFFCHDEMKWNKMDKDFLLFLFYLLRKEKFHRS